MNKKYHLPLLMTLLLFFLVSNAQQKQFKITYKRNSDNSVSFNYEKQRPGSTFVTITLNRLQNTQSSNTIRKTVKGTSGSLFTLRPTDPKRGVGFSYSYSVIDGNPRAKVKHDFKYILPFKNGKMVTAHDMKNLGDFFGNTPPKNWKSIQFLTTPNDTIYAARKGIVVDIKKNSAADTSKEFGYKRDANHITVEHADGTFAKYQVLKRNSSMVKLGDKVLPATPLAIAGTYDKPENSQLRFSIYYLDNEAVKSKQKNKQTLANSKHYHAYVNPLFYVDNGVTERLDSNKEHSVFITDEIIEFEMTKRERKKRLKNSRK